MKIYAIATTPDDSYQTTIQSNDHHYLSDEPVEKGGDDMGMTPKQLLCGAMASCTSITIRMYLKHKGWELGAVSVRVDYEEVEKNKFHFETEIRFTQDLTPDQEERIKIVAQKCPVHKIVHSSNVTSAISFA